MTPSLEDGCHDVPMGKVAAVVTHLEMRAAVAARPGPAPDGVTLERVAAPSADWYRALFRAVGAEEWLWYSRLVMPDAALKEILADPAVHIYAVMQDGTAKGLLELDFRVEGACELAFLGICSELIGGGVGRWMMTCAIELAWAMPIHRFHLHTCTLDHPAALPFYIRSGFVPVRQQIEIAEDPRLSGLLAATSAPQVPVFR